MRYTLTIQEKHLNELSESVIKKDGKERPALMLCGVSQTKKDVWNGGAECRFLSREVIPIPDQLINNHSTDHVEWQTEIFRKTLKRAKEEDLQICLVHSHPAGCESFSDTDNENELNLFNIIHKRNGSSLPNLSLVITTDGALIARVCTNAMRYHPIEFIRVIGNKFDFHYNDKYSGFNVREEFHRQQLAFGRSLNADLSKLRIGVVGCGATGSATAHLLARLGVGQLLLIDNDLIERSNLSRLYGAKSSDADSGSSKAKVLADFISGIGLGCRVRCIHNWVGGEDAQEAIRSCDIIFGCTDDNSGRILLNRLAYFYLIPYIDMGIIIEPNRQNSGKLNTLQGRVTVLIPGNTCLLCRSVVDRTLAREEQLRRYDPRGFERQKEEAYVVGEQNPSPAVITFTTEVATMSVNELLHRLTGFKKRDHCSHVVRFFDQGIDRFQNVLPHPDCPICSESNYWGRGDMKPFLDQVT